MNAKFLKDYPLNQWMEAADGCDSCGAKYSARVTFVDESGCFGDIEWKISHKDDCYKIYEEEETEGSDIAGWEFQDKIHQILGKTFLPLKTRANIGPCLECGKLVIDAPLILFIDEGRSGELDFCFGCAETLGILDQLKVKA